MTDSPSLRSLNCPNCGAPVEFPEARSSVRCRFCDSVIERSEDDPTPDDESHALKVNIAEGRVTVERVGDYTQGAKRFVIKMQGGQPMVIESTGPAGSTPAQTMSVGATTYTPPAARRRASGGGCVALLIVLLAVGIPVIAILAAVPNIGALFGQLVTGNVEDAVSNVATLGTRIYVGRTAALVPAQAEAAPDIVMLTTQYPPDNSDGELRLVAVSSASPKLLWQSDKLEKETYDAPILADDGLVFTVSKTRLLAIRRTDGSTAWEAKLEDEVSLNLCYACVQLADGRLFVLSNDGTLEAFDAATGKSLWSFSADEDSPRGLYVLNGQPAFMDREKDGYGVLRVFAPATGDARRLQPKCDLPDQRYSYADWTTRLHVSADGAAFYFFSDWTEPCAQKWDSRTLQPVWQVPVPNAFSLADNSPVLMTDDALYLALDQTILRFDAATGAVTTLVEDDDYRFATLATEDDALLVLATRQRGSTRYELWAVEAATGTQRWKFDMGEDPVIGGPFSLGGIIDENKPAWTWHAAPDGVQIIRFKRAEDDRSHALRYEMLNWQSGVSSGPKEILLGVETIILSAPGFIHWRDNLMWMEMEGGLMGFDAAKGEIVYRWP